MTTTRSFATAAALAALSFTAAAAPVSLGTVTHLYGSAAGRVAPTSLQPVGGSCDTLSATSVTVRDTASGCRRFADSFDFSAIDFDSVTGLTLTLSYASTNNLNWLIIIPVPEAWHVRPALDGSTASSTMEALTRVGSGGTTSVFDFDDSNLDIFDGVVLNRSFSLWFADQAWGANNFTLRSASLEVFGNPAVAAVPEPGSIALVAAAGLALMAAGRRRRG